MKLLDRWWVRLPIYGALILLAAWCAYHLAYRYSAGPHPDDSEADLADGYGLMWAAAVCVVALFVVGITEALRLMRPEPERRPATVAA